MSLTLALSVPDPRPSTLEGLVVELELANRDASPRTLPGPEDTSGALGFELFDTAGQRIRRADGLTHQAMMSTGRVDARPDLDVLPAGRSWRWTVDLASYHYGLPAGDYRLEAVYDPGSDDASSAVRSAPVDLHVRSEHVEDVVWSRDNPVLDGVTALFRVQDDSAPHGASAPHWCLRQHNTGRPLAAWYSTRLALDHAAEAPFLAAPSFFQTTSFDPGFRKWVVWQAGAEVRAQCFRFGEPEPGVRSAPLPAGARLLRSATVTEGDELQLFLLEGSQTVVAASLDASGLHERFRHSIPSSGPVEPVIRADCDFIHVATAHRGIVYDRLTPDGASKRRVQVFRTRLPARSLELDPVSRRIHGLFTDAPHGRNVTLAVAGPDPEETRSQRFESVQVRGELRELAFGHDSQGRFHLLVSTSLGKLYYYSDGRGPFRIAEGTLPFFPRVVSPSRAYLGFYERANGYRFFEFDRRHRGPKLIGRE